MIQSKFTYKKPFVKGLRDYLHETDRRLKGRVKREDVSEKRK